MGLKPKEFHLQVERKHIFTHIEWDMFGMYLSVAETDEVRKWLTLEQIKVSAALPTAFRLFWEEKQHV